MANYTQLTLLVFGLAGVLLHNLIQLSKLNKQADGNVNLGKYWRLERFSILISFIIVGLAVVASQEIKQLAIVGKWLGFGFTAIGYMGQSLLVAYMGKAAKVIGSEDSTK